MVLRILAAFALVTTVAVAAHAAEPAPMQPAPSAFPAISSPFIVAQDATCAATCQTEHDQCRVTTKGSASCDAARQRCLQACIASKKKH